MKLLNKVGNALLTKLVPGIDAKANCGRCSPGGISCKQNSGCYPYIKELWHDLCGNVCFTRCNRDRICGV